MTETAGLLTQPLFLYAAVGAHSKIFMKELILIIPISLFLSCSNPPKEDADKKKEIEKLYYDSGELMSEVTKINGKKDGRTIHYFQSGDTLEIQNWENGLKQGKTTKFFQNGQVLYVANYKNDSIITKEYTYRPDGSLEILHRFDEKGRITHEYQYDSIGNVVDESPWIILEPRKDTLLLGRENLFEVVLLNYDTTALIDFALGTATGESSGIKDSFPILNKEENRGVIKIKPNQKGEYKIAGVLIEKDTTRRGDGETDTLSVKKVHRFLWEFIVK